MAREECIVRVIRVIGMGKIKKDKSDQQSGSKRVSCIQARRVRKAEDWKTAGEIR
jgi:hypothetical protein